MYRGRGLDVWVVAESAGRAEGQLPPLGWGMERENGSGIRTPPRVAMLKLGSWESREDTSHTESRFCLPWSPGPRTSHSRPLPMPVAPYLCPRLVAVRVEGKLAWEAAPGAGAAVPARAHPCHALGGQSLLGRVCVCALLGGPGASGGRVQLFLAATCLQPLPGTSCPRGGCHGWTRAVIICHSQAAVALQAPAGGSGSGERVIFRARPFPRRQDPS